MFIYAQLSNQRDWSLLATHLREIDAIFFNYDFENIKRHDGSYFDEKIRAIGCGNRSIHAQMKGLHKNIFTFERIIDKFGSIDKMVTSMSAYDVVRMLADPKSEYKMIQLGEPLAWEYLRNVGIDGAKPDLHLRRFFGSSFLGISNNDMASVSEVLQEVERLSKVTGRTRFEIDYIIWTSMSEGICNETEVYNAILNFRNTKSIGKAVIADKDKTEEKIPSAVVKRKSSIANDRGLYDFETASQIMDSRGLKRNHRNDDISGKFRQFAKGGSSLHVKTARGKRYILYSTVTDFSNIKASVNSDGKEFIILENVKDKKSTAELERIMRESTNAVVLIPNGNRKLHNSAESTLPHEIVFFTNDNFEYVLSILVRNEENTK